MRAVWHQVRDHIYPETRFGGIAHVDGELRFYARIHALLTSESVVVDYGCGRGAHRAQVAPYYRGLMVLRGRARKVIGVDVDEGARENDAIDEFRALEGGRVPLPDGSVQLCLADWVVEHLEDADGFFAEMHRVLEPGGVLCVRTPNRLHYSSLGASLVPFRYHPMLRRRLGHFHQEEDVFPTTYPCNTVRALRRALERADFDALVYAHRGHSHLMGRGIIPGRLGKWIEALSPRLFWHELHAFGRKR